MAEVANEKRNHSNDGQVKEIEDQAAPQFSAAAERRLVWKIDLM